MRDFHVGAHPPKEFQNGVAASASAMERWPANGTNGTSKKKQILGPNGRPAAPARRDLGASNLWPGYCGGFKAAGHSRDTAHLPTMCHPTNDELRGGQLATMRARSRYVYNNHPHAHGLLDKIVRRVAGRGTKFQPSMQTEAGVQLRAENKMLEFILKAIGVSMTPAGDSFKGLRELGMLLRLIDGELFALETVDARNRIRLGGQSVQYSRQWQILDSDQLAENVPKEMLPGVKAGNFVDLGVEREKSGRVVAYYFYDDGGSVWHGFSAHRKTVRIPAEKVIHWFKRRHGGQVRGIPMLAPVLLPLADFEEYVKSQLTMAWVQTNNSAFLETEFPAEMQELFDDTENRAQQAWELATSADRPTMEIESGTIRMLNPYNKIKFNEPTAPGPNFDSFSAGVLRSAAAGTGYSYEMLAGDYTKTNFSSGQQTSADDQATSADLAEDMDDQFLDLVYDDALDFIYDVNGLMTPPPGTRDRYEHWVQHPVRPRIDQQKEERANTEALDNGSESVIGVSKKKNLDWHDVEDERLQAEAYTAQRRKELGLPEPESATETETEVAGLSATVRDLEMKIDDLTQATAEAQR